MSDLLHVLPAFSTAPYSHILPSIDKALITTSDLITLSPQEIAKRAQIPPAEVAKLSEAVVHALKRDNAFQQRKRNILSFDDDEVVRVISTLDPDLDLALGGGIRPGYVTEITGESGVGKTQFLLSLLLSVQLAPPNGISRSALYISTEAALSTKRLHQLLRKHPILSALPKEDQPSLDRVLSIQTPDLETQDHILRYQVPVAVKRQNVGLIIIDSIAANYRAEFERPNQPAATSSTPKTTSQGPSAAERRVGQSMAERKPQLIQLGTLLRNLARKEDIAIVVANQIADRFETTTTITPSAQTPAQTQITLPEPLTLDHQQKWFTGWGDLPPHIPGHLDLKTPSLGLIWTNQIAARIALVKENQPVSGSTKQRRWMRVVFAAWTDPTEGAGVEYDIAVEGLRAVVKDAAADAAAIT